MGQLKSFRDLKVYQKLKALHLEVHNETLGFPKFESYELGSHPNRSFRTWFSCSKSRNNLRSHSHG